MGWCRLDPFTYAGDDELRERFLTKQHEQRSRTIVFRLQLQ